MGLLNRISESALGRFGSSRADEEKGVDVRVWEA